MKKMIFAIMIATSVMSASFANAQTEMKAAPSAQQKSEKTVKKTEVKKTEVKKAETGTTAPATKKVKTMSKTEKTTTTTK